MGERRLTFTADVATEHALMAATHDDTRLATEDDLRAAGFVPREEWHGRFVAICEFADIEQDDLSMFRHVVEYLTVYHLDPPDDVVDWLRAEAEREAAR